MSLEIFFIIFYEHFFKVLFLLKQTLYHSTYSRIISENLKMLLIDYDFRKKKIS